MKNKCNKHCENDREKHSQLIKEIKDLSKEKEEVSRNLEECLMFYLEKIAPEERELLSAIIERAVSFCDLYKASKINFSKEELIILEKLILSEIQSLLPLIGLEGLTAELKAMYKQLNRLDATPKVSSKEQNGSSASGASGFTGSQSFQEEERKTKKQMQREEEHEESKKVRKKSIMRLYKRLVKAFHPDLEPDDEAKIWKEEMMKRIANAYEERDLYGLMEIEEEFMSYLPEEEEIGDSEEFMAYNAVLEGKIEALRNHINHLAASPKYGSLHRFFRNQSIGTCILMLEYEKLKETVGGIRSFIQSLQGSDGEGVFKALVKEISR